MQTSWAIRILAPAQGTLVASYAGTFQSDDARGVERKLDVVQFQDSVLHCELKELLAVYEGRAELEMAAPGDATPSSEVVGPGAAFRIRPGTVHRVAALDDTLILEVSTPHLDDIVRLEDRYGRTDS